MKTFTLPKAVLELHRFTSTDVNRIHLRRIHIEREGDKLIAVVTDGHRLAKFTWAPENISELPEKIELAVSIKAVKEAARGKRSDPDAVLEFDLSDGAVPQSVMIRKGSLLIQAAAEPGTFPDWRQVTKLTDDAPEAGAIGVNALYVGDIGTYLKKVYAPKTNIRFTSYGPLHPIRIDHDGHIESGGTFHCIIMPVRIT